MHLGFPQLITALRSCPFGVLALFLQSFILFYCIYSSSVPDYPFLPSRHFPSLYIYQIFFLNHIFCLPCLHYEPRSISATTIYNPTEVNRQYTHRTKCNECRSWQEQLVERISDVYSNTCPQTPSLEISWPPPTHPNGVWPKTCLYWKPLSSIKTQMRFLHASLCFIDCTSLALQNIFPILFWKYQFKPNETDFLSSFPSRASTSLFKFNYKSTVSPLFNLIKTYN